MKSILLVPRPEWRERLLGEDRFGYRPPTAWLDSEVRHEAAYHHRADEGAAPYGCVVCGAGEWPCSRAGEVYAPAVWRPGRLPYVLPGALVLQWEGVVQPGGYYRCKWALGEVRVVSVLTSHPSSFQASDAALEAEVLGIGRVVEIE